MPTTLYNNLETIKNSLIQDNKIINNIINHTEPIPYIELEYIQSNGNAFINTLDNMTDTMEFDVKVSDVGINCVIFGVQTNSNFIFCGLNGGNRNYEYYFYDTNYLQSMLSASSNTYKNIIFHKGVNYFDIKDFNNNVIKSKTRTVNSYNMNLTLYLGTNNSNGTPQNNPYVMKLYYYKSYTNGTLTKHLIPVKRKSDNEICMYDLIAQNFYLNVGSNPFVAGPEVNS